MKKIVDSLQYRCITCKSRQGTPHWIAMKCYLDVDKKIRESCFDADLKIKKTMHRKFILNLNHVKKTSKFNNPESA